MASCVETSMCSPGILDVPSRPYRGVSAFLPVLDERRALLADGRVAAGEIGGLIVWAD